MLSEIWSLMQTGKTYSMQQLAETLDTSPELIKSGMEHLARLGYIKQVDSSATCSKSCMGCHGCDMKGFLQSPIMWERVR